MKGWTFFLSLETGGPVHLLVFFRRPSDPFTQNRWMFKRDVRDRCGSVVREFLGYFN